MLRSRISALVDALAGTQARRPGVVALVAALITALCVPLILQLGLRGDLTALLPETKAAVVDLEKIQGRFGKAATLSVAISGDEAGGAGIPELRLVTQKVAERLEAAKLPHVISVDWNLGDLETFIEKNGYLYADLADLKEAREKLHERIEREKEKANPLDLGLDDEDEKAAPEGVDDLVKKFRQKLETSKSQVLKFPGGYFQHPKLPLIVFFVRTDIEAGRTKEAGELLASVKALAEEGRGAVPGKVRFDYGGDLMDMMEEVAALEKEVAIATLITNLLVFLSVYFFFSSFRAIPVLGFALIVPVAATFAIAELAVDYLNTSTAFLSSIVVGNGINPMIIWLARYYEMRRGGADVHASVRDCHERTWAATLTAAGAAGMAYLSLVITDFRGFRDFGVIGGTGMALCWASTFTLLPALAVLSDRWRPIRPVAGSHRTPYGVWFAWLALKAPKAVVGTALVLTAVSLVLVVNFVRQDPMEYDFRKLQSVRDPDSRVSWVNTRQGEIVDETMTGSSIAVLLPTREEVPGVVAQLQKLSAENPGKLGAIRTVDDVIPTQQAEKITELRELRRLLLDARRFAKDDQKKEIDGYMPPAELAQIAQEQVPEVATRMYRELDGALGRIVFVEHHLSRNAWDGAYLIEWSDLTRQIRMQDGERPPVTGMPPVFADLLDSVRTDGPKTVAAALCVTCLLLFVTFRRFRDQFLSLASLLGGVLWMCGALALMKLRLNFLNFVAFPITFGNGVDYSVNLMTRFNQEEADGYRGEEAARRTLEATGGAIVLCSLTTIIGYISLYASSNQALNSFGAAMSISEFTCVGAAICVLPAWLALRDKQGKSSPPAPTPAGEAASVEE